MNMKVKSIQEANLSRLMRHPRLHELTRILEFTTTADTQKELIPKNVMELSGKDSAALAPSLIPEFVISQ